MIKRSTEDHPFLKRVDSCFLKFIDVGLIQAILVGIQVGSTGFEVASGLGQTKFNQVEVT